MKDILQTQNLKFVNGALIDGTMLVDVDSDCDNVIIPDDTQTISCISRDIDLSKVKKITVHTVDFLNELTSKFIKQYPKQIVIDCTTMCKTSRGHYTMSFEATAISKIFNCPGVEYVDIVNHDRYKTIDGIMYTLNGTILCECPKSRKGEVKIPEGTVYIEPRAFIGCQIESVIFPDSLKEIQYSAFQYCKNLKYITVGNGITTLGNRIHKFIFANCPNLKYIEIPSQVKIIGEDAFANSGLESVLLHEGLEIIYREAFWGCENMEEVTIPKTVKDIHKDAFSKIRRINASIYNLDIIHSFNFGCTEYEDENLPQMVELNIGQKSVVIPRCMEKEGALVVDFILWNYFEGKEDENFAEKARRLYIYASTKKSDYDTAIETYKRNSDDEYTAEYIRNKSNDIVARMWKEKDEQGLTDFVSLGVIEEPALRRMLQFAENERMTTLTAYILEAMHNSKKENLIL